MIDVNDMFDGCYLRRSNGALHGPCYYDSVSGYWKWEDCTLKVTMLEYYDDILSVQISKTKSRIKDGDIVKLRNGVVLGEIKKDGTKYLVLEYPDFIKEVWYSDGRKSDDPQTSHPKDIMAVLDKKTGKFVEV